MNDINNINNINDINNLNDINNMNDDINDMIWYEWTILNYTELY
jgi:hypothetical protein